MEDSDRDRCFRDEYRPERRVYPRVRVKVPVELFAPGSDVPQRGATDLPPIFSPGIMRLSPVSVRPACQSR
jgi:hypothetical protein